MSASPRNNVLRAILADDTLVKVAEAFGIPGKTESKKIPLTSGQLTTDQIVGRIKELSRLRDEILQVMRQLNLTREASPSPDERLDYDSQLESTKRDMDEARDKYQELQGKIEKIQRQIDDSKKRIASLRETSQTGFATDQLESDAGSFRRVLGRLPLKKLEAARKAVQSQFKDQVILAVGNKKQDAIYVLVATPKDRYSMALQTLLIYDFSPIEIPEYKSQDIKTEIQEDDDRAKILARELDELKLQLDDLRKKRVLTLNHKLDEVIGALMMYRGILKLGDGTEASRIYVQLEKVLPAETITNLSKRGIIELESS